MKMKHNDLNRLSLRKNFVTQVNKNWEKAPSGELVFLKAEKKAYESEFVPIGLERLNKATAGG